MRTATTSITNRSVSNPLLTRNLNTADHHIMLRFDCEGDDDSDDKPRRRSHLPRRLRRSSKSDQSKSTARLSRVSKSMESQSGDSDANSSDDERVGVPSRSASVVSESNGFKSRRQSAGLAAGGTDALLDMLVEDEDGDGEQEAGEEEEEEDDFGDASEEESEDPWAVELQEKYVAWRQTVDQVPHNFFKLVRVIMNVLGSMKKLYQAAAGRNQQRAAALQKPGNQRTIKERFLVEEVIVRYKYFRNLLPEQTSALTKHVYHKVYAAGDNIYKDGDPASAYYIVASGHVQILRKRENDDSKRVVVAEHFTGESFGEATLSLGPKTRHTTIGFCYSQCEIFTITRQGYMETVAKSHFERVQAVTTLMKQLPCFRPLLKSDQGRQLLDLAAAAFVERVVPQGTVVVQQDEESDINFFYLVKKGRLQVIRRVDVQRLRDAKDSIQEETPAAVLRHSPFPNAESVDAKIDQMFELQSGQKDVLRSGLSRKAIETPVKEEPTEWEAVREHTKKTDSVSKCKRGAARSVALTIDEIQAGSCFVRNTWLRKYNQPSPVSLLAASETHLLILNKWDFIRTMALSEGHDLLGQLEYFQNDKQLMCELQEGEHWEAYKADIVKKHVSGRKLSNLVCSRKVRRNTSPRRNEGETSVCPLWDEKPAAKTLDPRSFASAQMQSLMPKITLVTLKSEESTQAVGGVFGMMRNRLGTTSRRLSAASSTASGSASEGKARNLHAPSNGGRCRDRTGPTAQPTLQTRLLQQHASRIVLPPAHASSLMARAGGGLGLARDELPQGSKSRSPSVEPEYPRRRSVTPSRFGSSLKTSPSPARTSPTPPPPQRRPVLINLPPRLEAAVAADSSIAIPISVNGQHGTLQLMQPQRARAASRAVGDAPTHRDGDGDIRLGLAESSPSLVGMTGRVAPGTSPSFRLTMPREGPRPTPSSPPPYHSPPSPPHQDPFLDKLRRDYGHMVLDQEMPRAFRVSGRAGVSGSPSPVAGASTSPARSRVGSGRDVGSRTSARSFAAARGSPALGAAGLILPPRMLVSETASTSHSTNNLQKSGASGRGVTFERSHSSAELDHASTSDTAANRVVKNAQSPLQPVNRGLSHKLSAKRGEMMMRMSSKLDQQSPVAVPQG